MRRKPKQWSLPPCQCSACRSGRMMARVFCLALLYVVTLAMKLAACEVIGR